MAENIVKMTQKLFAINSPKMGLLIEREAELWMEHKIEHIEVKKVGLGLNLG